MNKKYDFPPPVQFLNDDLLQWIKHYGNAENALAAAINEINNLRENIQDLQWEFSERDD